MRLVLVAMPLVVGCSLGDPVQLDVGAAVDGTAREGGSDGRSVDGFIDGAGEASAWDSGLGEGGAVGGSLTQILSRVEALGERLCDLDDDGIADNAIADLGTPATEIFVAALTTLFEGTYGHAAPRVISHFPWIDDLRAPHDLDTRYIVFEGLDLDGDSSNDFSGSNAFRVSPDSVDGCGEPIHFFSPARIDEGTIETFAGTVPIVAGAATATLHVGYSVGPLGQYSDVCAYMTIAELADLESLDAAGRSLLEVLLVGGAVFGVPSLPGLIPDLDLDGDGLERVLLDDDGRVESCVDGDATVIVGRACPMDGRIADALSLSFRLHVERARFGGRPLFWEEDCPEGPPERSLWDQW